MNDIEEYEAALQVLKKAQKHVVELAKINDPFGENPALVAAFDKVISHLHHKASDWRDRDRFLRKKYEL